MRSNYTHPQSIIKQTIESFPVQAAERLNAFVIGPQYFLKRYGKEELTGQVYDTALTELSYEDVLESYKVDTDFVKVFVEKAQAELANYTGSDVIRFEVDSSDLHKIELIDTGSGNVGVPVFGSSSLDTDLQDRPVKIGDKVKLTYGATDIYRTVRGLEENALGVKSILVLDGVATDPNNPSATTPDAVSLRIEFNGEITREPEWAISPRWTADEDPDNGVTLSAPLQIFVEDRSSGNEIVDVQPESFTRVFVSYRALVPAQANATEELVRSETELESKFGVIDPDNTVAFGAYWALKGAMGDPIYVTTVRTNDREGYREVFRRAENKAVLYACVVLTEDIQVQLDLQRHVEEMSQPTTKRWRRAYNHTESPGVYAILDEQSDGSPYEAVFLGANGTQLVTPDIDFTQTDIQSGDKVRVFNQSASDEYDEFIIQSVFGANELILETGPGTITSETKFEIWAADTGLNQVRFVGNRSKQFSSNRVCNIWVDSPQVRWEGGLIPQKVMFVACEIVGLRSAMLPQQGLTRVELESISEAPVMYTKYNQADLDWAAANGTFIVTQDIQNGPVYVRHQLTTSTIENPLEYEDNTGVNRDDISYASDDLVQPFIGQRNLTARTLRELRNRYEDMLIEKTKADVEVIIGPQIVEILEGSIFVRQAANTADTVELGSRIAIPTPIGTVIVENSFSTPLNQTA